MLPHGAQQSLAALKSARWLSGLSYYMICPFRNHSPEKGVARPLASMPLAISSGMGRLAEDVTRRALSPAYEF
jgi:hypothetical protein